MTLLLRAVATGCLDLSEANSSDPVWLTRERLMLREVERTATVDFLRMHHDQDAVAAAGWPAWDQEGSVYKFHLKRAQGVAHQIGKSLFPYEEWDPEELARSKGKADRLRYLQAFGDPTDPKVAAELQRLAYAFREQRANAKKVETRVEPGRRGSPNRERSMSWKARANVRSGISR